MVVIVRLVLWQMNVINKFRDYYFSSPFLFYIKKMLYTTIASKIPSATPACGKRVIPKYLGYGIFANKKKLKTVVIGKNVTTISKKAFANCGALKTVTISSKKLKTVGKKAFAGIHKKAVFKVSGNAKYKSKVKKLLSSKTGYQKTMKIK